MSLIFKLGKDDTGPPLRAQALKVVNRVEVPYPIDPSSTVVFNMSNAVTGDVVCDGLAAIIENAAQGIVRFEDWEPAHTADAGVFEAEFEVTAPDTTVITIPNNDPKIRVIISADNDTD